MSGVRNTFRTKEKQDVGQMKVRHVFLLFFFIIFLFKLFLRFRFLIFLLHYYSVFFSFSYTFVWMCVCSLHPVYPLDPCGRHFLWLAGLLSAVGSVFVLQRRETRDAHTFYSTESQWEKSHSYYCHCSI